MYDYNNKRPYNSLGNLPPVLYTKNHQGVTPWWFLNNFIIQLIKGTKEGKLTNVLFHASHLQLETIFRCQICHLRYIIYSIKIRLFCGIFSTIFDIFTHNKTEVFSLLVPPMREIAVMGNLKKHPFICNLFN